MVSVIMFPVDTLKEVVKRSVMDGHGKVVMGGDDKASEIALIPLKELVSEL